MRVSATSRLRTWHWVLALAAADIITTLLGLRHGASELNPLAGVLGGVALFLVLKAVVIAMLCWRWRRRGEGYWDARSRAVVLGIMGAVVAWNTGVLLGGLD